MKIEIYSMGGHPNFKEEKFEIEIGFKIERKDIYKQDLDDLCRIMKSYIEGIFREEAVLEYVNIDMNNGTFKYKITYIVKSFII